MYQARRPSRSETVPIRNLPYHVRIWGEPAPGRTPLVMVHGWMDVSASFQFVVDAFAQEHYVIAPDWRGYGKTPGGGTDNYWFADYMADLDFLLDHYAKETPVNLVGHSLGGNVAMLYTGVRPERVRRLVNLEGFGGARHTPDEAPKRYAQWMDELKALHRGEMALNTYPDALGVARRLMKTNPRLTQDKADWLAQHWASPGADGRWAILGDPAHKVVNAQLTRIDETLELYRRITVPTLAVEADTNSLQQWWKGRFTLDEYHERLKALPDVRVALIRDAAHMLHHDQPEALARALEDFLG